MTANRLIWVLIPVLLWVLDSDVRCLAAAPGAVDPRLPETIFQWTAPDGTQRIGDRSSLPSAGVAPSAARPAFLALPAEEWPGGFVPIFVVERNGRFELRRRPLRGTENLSEPLFLALPPAGDAAALRIAGTWRCTATRPGSSDSWFAWQLTTDGENVIGRFDPGSDYRVAYLKGGTFRSNRIELTVEYSGETYQLTGGLRDGKLAGHWEGSEKGENGNRGRWEATRDSLPGTRTLAIPGEPVLLREWRRESDEALHYTLDASPGPSSAPSPPGPGWKPTGRNLCRVWPIAPAAPIVPAAGVTNAK